MTVINDGTFYKCEQLFFYLEELFRLNEDHSDFENDIEYIENHEGYWTIGFKTVPPHSLMIAIIALFDTRLALDGIGKVIFFYGTPNTIEIEDVAGCYSQGPDATYKVLRIVDQHSRAHIGARRNSSN